MDIVEELRRDRESGAKRLVNEYKAGMMSLAMRFCADESSAEELVNATFAKVVANIDGYLEQSAFFAWMCQILTNLYRDSVKRTARKNEVLSGDVPDMPDDDARDEIFRNVDHSLLRDAIETLPKEMKEAIMLHYIADQPIGVAARFLRLPVSTVKWRLHAARRELSRRLGAKVSETARNPGGKALLLALALACTAALGAAVWRVASGWGEPSRRADATWTSETGGTGATGATGTTSASPASPARPAGPPDPTAPLLSAFSPTPTNTTMKTSRLLAPPLAALSLVPIAATAATTISIDSAVQRWPWNNKLDITYTVTGGQDLAGGSYERIEFTTVIDGKTYTIDGTKDVGASASAGTHTVTWTLPSGVKRKDCTISAAIYASDAPSGDDYMVVDLENGGVSFEGLLATQEASNARYNTPEYKTSKLVLRKVPAGGPYPTGDSVHYPSENPSRTWTTERDFWIGVFPVTQAQYAKLCGSNPSYFPKDSTDNPAAYRPVENVSWYDIRRPVGETGNFASNADIPAVSAPSGNFLQRLRLLGGNKYPFDLPTEVMAEIAERAGSDAVYYWGGSPNADYVTYSGNAGSPTSTQDVGARLPNAWGLYDTCGNVWEWCLDDGGLGNLAEAPDPFTPRWTPGTYRRRRCGGSVWNPLDSVNHRASMRSNTTEPAGNAGSFIGFRVALVGE